MLRIKYIIRSLLRKKTNTTINIIGLSLSMTVFLFLALFVQNELGYDKQFSDYENIYRITTDVNTPGNTQHLALAPAPLKNVLKNEFPAVEDAASVTEIPDRYAVKYNDVQFMQDGFREASPNIFNVLDYKVLSGNLSTALKEPNSVVLTRSLATKLLGNDPQLNSEIFINNKPHKVTAIIKDLPKNMDLQFSALLPGYLYNTTDWTDFDGGHLYVKFRSNVPYNIRDILNRIIEKYYNPIKSQLNGIDIKLVPQRIDKIHFSNELLADSPKGNILYVYFFSIVAFIILIIACINYINLAFARLSERNYFTGICVINGAGRGQSNYYLLIESLLMTFLSVIISFILVAVFLPYFNHLTGKDIPPDGIYSIRFLEIILFVFITLNLIIAGIPALLSILVKRKNVVHYLVRNDHSHPENYRGMLVVAQFIFTIALIICLVAFQRQMNYMKNKKLGFDPEGVQVIETPPNKKDLSDIRHFTDQLQRIPGVVKVSLTGGGSVPGIQYGGTKELHASPVNGVMKQFLVSFCDIDNNYLDLMGIKLIKGENFSDNPKENTNKCIINESFAKALEIKDDPLGKITTDFHLKVIGVVRDFNFLSPQNPITPMCFRYFNNYPNNIIIKTKFNILPALKAAWSKTVPDYPFVFKDLATSYNKQYFKDDSLFEVVLFFTFLSILISCLGVVGLIKYTCERRIKEIGIRKVCGAEVKEILSMINKEFIKWIFIAFLVSCPLAWFVVNKWLENYAYKITVGAEVFALSGLLIAFISMALVSLLTWQSANKNPVEALRYE